MNRNDLKEQSVDELISMIDKMNLKPLVYATNGKNRKKGEPSKNKGMLITHLMKNAKIKNDENEDENVENDEIKNDENVEIKNDEIKNDEIKNDEVKPPVGKMHKWCSSYISIDNFMSELYTEEQITELTKTCKGNKKLIALHLWKSFSKEQKLKIFG